MGGGVSNGDVVIKHLNMSPYSQLTRFNNDDVYLVTLFFGYFGYFFDVRPLFCPNTTPGPNSERDSIVLWAVKSSFKAGLQISRWRSIM